MRLLIKLSVLLLISGLVVIGLPKVRAQTTTISLQANVPTGAVMAFDAATCPTGWSTFNTLRGRVLVGAGTGNNDADGTALTARTLGDLGGREFTTGIPATIGSANSEVPAPNKQLALMTDAGGGSIVAYRASPANTTIGGVKADSNMMPYAVILYCQKN